MGEENEDEQQQEEEEQEEQEEQEEKDELTCIPAGDRWKAPCKNVRGLGLGRRAKGGDLHMRRCGSARMSMASCSKCHSVFGCYRFAVQIVPYSCFRARSNAA